MKTKANKTNKTANVVNSHKEQNGKIVNSLTPTSLGEVKVAGAIRESTDTKGMLTARRFSELLRGGAPLEQAARVLGLPIRILKKREDVEAALKDMGKYSLPANVRKEMVRSALNRVVLENDGNSRGTKSLLEATKQIAHDPEVGLDTPPVTNVGVNVDLRYLEKFIGNADNNH